MGSSNNPWVEVEYKINKHPEYGVSRGIHTSYEDFGSWLARHFNEIEIISIKDYDFGSNPNKRSDLSDLYEKYNKLNKEYTTFIDSYKNHILGPLFSDSEKRIFENADDYFRLSSSFFMASGKISLLQQDVYLSKDLLKLIFSVVSFFGVLGILYVYLHGALL